MGWRVEAAHLRRSKRIACQLGIKNTVAILYTVRRNKLIANNLMPEVVLFSARKTGRRVV